MQFPCQLAGDRPDIEPTWGPAARISWSCLLAPVNITQSVQRSYAPETTINPLRIRMFYPDEGSSNRRSFEIFIELYLMFTFLGC